MARPVTLKYVVSFSSQDDVYSVQNLLKDGCFKKWLSDSKNRSGTMEAVFQLEKACIMSYLDIGTHWCSNISVQVGKSGWPQSHEFEPLLHNTCLMTQADVRLGRNTTNTKMFNTSDFCSDAVTKMWDRIRVVCQQNFRKNVQFGLTFLRIKASKIEDSPVNAEKTDQLSKSIHVNEESPQSVNEKIQNYFFKGKQLKSPVSDARLETQLLKIASTSDNGTVRVEGLSRTANILKAAQENVGKYAPSKYCKQSQMPSGKKSFFAELIAHNQSPLPKGEDEKMEENLSSKHKNVQNTAPKGNQVKSPVAGHCLNNIAQPEGLSRSAQMLMVAQENAGKYDTKKRYKPSSNSSRKPLFFSEMKAQKESLLIQEEIDEFLSKLDIKTEELDSITIADLRHRFEKKKKRKLTKEERKLYVDKVSGHINKIFSQSSQNQDEFSEERQQTKRMRIEPPRPALSGRHWQHPKEKRKSKVNNDDSLAGFNKEVIIMDDQKDSYKETNKFKKCNILLLLGFFLENIKYLVKYFQLFEVQNTYCKRYTNLNV